MKMKMRLFDESSKFRQIASIAFAVGALLTEPKAGSGQQLVKPYGRDEGQHFRRVSKRS